MAQEFTIKSEKIEDKINQLLPSQGGFQPGVDFSASTMVIPIVDLTETAEGSSLRQDLQRSFSLTSNTSTFTTNTTNTLINTTGYFNVFGTYRVIGSVVVSISITDGTTTKVLYRQVGATGDQFIGEFDFNVFLPAGVSVTANTTSSNADLFTTTRQIADINGNLTNPV
tara:strand:+ start:53 stop:559 length:507 start_codon:yes stop_codon:yes gene_type:complete